MGLVAGKLSDLVIITSDNPRTEDPLKIISQIENGLKKTTCSYLAISDRREAIYQAIKAANPNDVVLIAGKGHETYQMIGSDKFHFDDREIAIEALNRIND
jgi:UDP-N-acetylmuramoyl-L-alanyl-D-glutamate--2,6-diaminopimelate ligase